MIIRLAIRVPDLAEPRHIDQAFGFDTFDFLIRSDRADVLARARDRGLDAHAVAELMDLGAEWYRERELARQGWCPDERRWGGIS